MRPFISPECSACVVSLFLLNSLLGGCSGVRPDSLGVREGRLSACPPTPNCVSSQSVDGEHRVEPLSYESSPAEAMALIKRIILGMNRARIVEESGNYLHAEFRSAVFRFVDDLEVQLDDTTKTIHVRSAARMGTYDFGVNRRRVEAIRSAWKAAARR